LTIEWIKCSERMPPDDYDYKIITIDSCGVCTDDGESLNSITDWCIEDCTIWTQFTQEKWNELNK